MTDHPGLLIRLCCDHCSEKIGDFTAHDTGLNDEVTLLERGAYGRSETVAEVTKDIFYRRQGLGRGPMTQVRTDRTVRGTYSWRCRCGANPQRSVVRLGRLEIDERTNPPRVYV